MMKRNIKKIANIEACLSHLEIILKKLKLNKTELEHDIKQAELCKKDAKAALKKELASK
jgi:hypothetical protein